jgi:hypothetical protein
MQWSQLELELFTQEPATPTTMPAGQDEACPEPAVADPIAARIRQRSTSADPCERQGVVHRAAMAPCELSSDLLACAGARDAPAVLTLRVEHWCQAGPGGGGLLLPFGISKCLPQDGR